MATDIWGNWDGKPDYGAPIQGSGPLIQGSSPNLQRTGNPQSTVVAPGNFVNTWDPMKGGHSFAPNGTGGGSGARTGGGGGSTSTASAEPALDQNIIDSWNAAIGQTQAGLERLPSYLDSSMDAIGTSAKNALSQLLAGKNQAFRDYGTNTQRTQQEYVGAKNTIGSNAGSTLSGLMRLLGSRGAGGGSAYLTAAPQAVAGAATMQRNDVGKDYAYNRQGLDTAWNDYLTGPTGYDYQVSSVESQKTQAEDAAKRQFQTTKAGLLQTLGDQQGQLANYQGGSYSGSAKPYLAQANALLDSAVNYKTAPINYEAKAYTAPALATYTTNPMAAPQYNGGGGGSDYFSPYLSALLEKKQIA